MEHTAINNIYDRISRILKNDQKYSYAILGKRIVECTVTLGGIDRYYDKYPPLVDVAELGAALAYEGSGHHEEIVKQIKYKLSELRTLLPDIR